MAVRLNSAAPSVTSSSSTSDPDADPRNPPLMPPLTAGDFPAAPNMPPPGPVGNNGAPKTLRELETVPVDGLAPKGLKSFSTVRDRPGTSGDLLCRGGLSLEVRGDEGEELGPYEADVRRGGKRPPGTY